MYNISMYMWQSPSKDSACESVESILYGEDITMKRLTHILGRWGVVPLLGLALLMPPQPAEARVEVNVGLGVPAPVVVAPAPVVVRRGHYYHRPHHHSYRGYYPGRYYRPHRHYYRRYYPGSYYRYPHRHWRHHHSWHRW
jgi:hypothetical protein